MKIYLVTDLNYNQYLDCFDGMVVAAKSPVDAKTLHPSGARVREVEGQWVSQYYDGAGNLVRIPHTSAMWPEYASIDRLKVKYLGNTKLERGVILTSFNAG